jgi:pyruvate dehydrogenase E2 component (dihydrolipoamide acetyltransferase)
MASEIVVPRLGWNMDQGVFLGWLKRDGEMVQAGEPLFKLEGDKSVQEVEAMATGVLHIASPGPAEGDIVAIGTLLGHIAAIGEKTRIAVQSSSGPGRQAVTPRARRIAVRLGIDLKRVSGTGKNGRVRERDVLALAARAEPGPQLSPTRRTIAQRLVHSLRMTAPVTLTTTVDATNLVSLRGQFKSLATSAEDAVPSYTDFLLKLTALALRQHPHLAARWKEDQLVMPGEINIGLAVDTEAGLVVPVMRDVVGLTIRRIARLTSELAHKARVRQLTAEEMQGGTFTITNLGPFGIDAFTPIINWPEVAILGVGRIHRQPTVVNDQVVPHEQMTLSLTVDHRVVDGAPAARFLQHLCKGIENPSAWLVE